MELLRSEFLFKFRNKISPKKKDFSFYIYKLKTIAPLSFEMLGLEFFKKTVPLYFDELVINQANLIENIYYFPLYLKKNFGKLQSYHSHDEYIVELMDYEFAQFMIQTDKTSNKIPFSNENPTEVFLNPFTQAIRHEYDIHEFAKKFSSSLVKKLIPRKNKNLLLISKDPNTQQIVFLKGTMNHAAIIDELHDGKISKKVLLQTLQAKYPMIGQNEWIMALGDLKKHFMTQEL